MASRFECTLQVMFQSLDEILFRASANRSLSFVLAVIALVLEFLLFYMAEAEAVGEVETPSVSVEPPPEAPPMGAPAEPPPEDSSDEADKAAMKRPASKATAAKSTPKNGQMKRPAAAMESEATPKVKAKAKAGKASGKGVAAPAVPVPKPAGKALAKGKALPKPPPKPSSPKPAAPKPSAPSGSKPAPMKKPASTKIDKLTAQFELSDEDDDDDQMEGAAPVDEFEEALFGDMDEGEKDDKRDRVKSRKFSEMLKKGTVPALVLDAYHQCTSRQDQTRLINTVFAKKADGKYVLQDNFTTPVGYKLDRSLEKEEKAVDNMNGFGRLIFRKKYDMTDEELDASVARGEVVTWSHGGLQLFAATNIKFSTSASRTTKEQMFGKEVEFDEKMGQEFMKIFDGMLPQVSSPARPNAKAASVVDDSNQPRQCPFLIVLAFFSCCNLAMFLLCSQFK